LGITKRRRGTFIGIGGRPLDAVDRIAGDSVVLAEVIEERG
jgi:hypothetical protein